MPRNAMSEVTTDCNAVASIILLAEIAKGVLRFTTTGCGLVEQEMTRGNAEVKNSRRVFCSS